MELAVVKVNALALFTSSRLVFVSAQCKESQINSANSAVSTTLLLAQESGIRDQESGPMPDS
jgi:hypothetical protein